jgi:transcriptional regulator with XRE-family HTH domain
MRNDKQQAIVLRRRGFSYNEIVEKLGIPKSTLSSWFHGMVLSSAAQGRIAGRVHASTIRSIVKRNKRQTHIARKRAKENQSRAAREIKNISSKQLLLVGAALYWAEGYKRLRMRNGREITSHPVVMTNSDPRLILIYLRFLREICKIPNERIKASVRLYEHMNEKKILAFWGRITSLPEEHFHKTYYGVSKSSKSKRPFNRLPHGTVAIQVNDTNLFHTIMGWIEGLAKLG